MRTAAAMTRDVLVIQPETGLAVARRLMERRRIRHLPVVAAGRLVGVLSDRDVLRYGGSEPDLSRLSCGQCMTPAPVTCSPDTSVGRVAQLMLTHKIDCVPVVLGDARLVGLVTSSDLLSLLVDRPDTESLPFEYRVRIAEAEELTS